MKYKYAREYIAAKLLAAKRELSWVILGQVLSAAGTLFGLKILTAYLGRNGYGRFALSMTVPGIAAMFLFGAPGMVITRYLWACREENKAGSFLLIMQWWYIAMFLLTILISVVMSFMALSRLGPAWALLLIGAGVYAAVNGMVTGLNLLHGALRNRKTVAIYQMADAWGRALFALGFVVIFKPSPLYAMLGYVGVVCLLLVVLWSWTRKTQWIVTARRQKSSSAEIKPLMAHMLKYSAPAIIWSLLAALGIYSDRWVVAAVLGSSAVGVYVALYQIASRPVQLMVGVVAQWLNPIIFQRASASKRNDQIKNSMRLVKLSVWLTLMIGGIGAILAYLYGSWLIRIFTNADFAVAGGFLWWFVLGATMFLIGQNLVNIGLVHWSTWRYIPAYMVQGMVVVGATYWMARWYGLPGAAAGFFVGNAAYALCVVIVNRRLRPAQIQVDHAMEIVAG